MNTELKAMNPKSFLIPIASLQTEGFFSKAVFFPLSYSFTKAPQFDFENGRVQLNLEYLFYDAFQDSFHVSEGDRNKVIPEYLDSQQNE